MEKIIELKPLFKQLIFVLSILFCLMILLSIARGFSFFAILFMIFFMLLISTLHLIQISNIIEFYQDRVKVQNMITGKVKIFEYKSISKIKFETSKDVCFIKIKFKDGKSTKKHCACTKRQMQEAEEKFWDAFPHLS